MHEFRKQTGRAQRQAVDGFLSGTARPQPAARPVLRRPMRLDGLHSTSRRLDNFKRPDGLHAAGPVSTQASQPLGDEAVRPVAQRPARNQASVLHMTLPSGGVLSGVKDRKARKAARKQERARRRGKWHSIRKWSLRSGLVLTALVLLLGGFLGIKASMKLHKVFKGGGTAAALQANVKPQLLKGEGDGRINFLLLGKGGDGHDGPDLTDTMLVASIDPVNKTAALVSIPRDLWVSVPGYGQMKINAVYANAKYHDLNLNPKDTAKAETDGINLAEQQVTNVLGIPIHYYVMIDFHAFEQAVDTVGGVDINVPASAAVTDYMYNEDTHRPYTLSVGAGMQHFDGLRALMYARTRHTSARGDFDRTERQRLLIEALSQKVLSAGTYTNPLKLSQLMSAFGDHVSTDMSINDSLRLMSIAKGITGSAIQSVGLADPPNNYVRTDQVGSLSVVRPTAGFDNYNDIQNYVRNTLKDPYLAQENASVEVLNGTATAGLATTKGNLLKSYGYNVTKIDTAPTSNYQKTVVVDLTGGKKPYTKNYLGKRFGVTVVSKLPDTAIQATGADFVVILGQDAATNQQN